MQFKYAKLVKSHENGENSQNERFWAKRDLFGKKRKCHLRTLIIPQLCARNQNKPMNGF